MFGLDIIIPCYNSSKTIEKCLDSIPKIDQIHIIIIDDSSDDSTVAVVENYISKYSKSHIELVCNKQNMGPGKSRNIGIELAKQEYLTFLDSDDLLNSDFKDILAVYDNKYDCIVFDAIRKFEKKDVYLKMFFSNEFDQGLINKKEAFVYIRGCTCGKIYRTSIIKSKEKLFGDLKRNEDLIFTKTSIVDMDTIFYISKPLYIYMNNVNSIMNASIDINYDYEQSAYEMICSKIDSDYYRDEINGVYFLEVLYATTMKFIRNHMPYSVCKNKFLELKKKYDEKNMYYRKFNTKYKFIYILFRVIFLS